MQVTFGMFTWGIFCCRCCFYPPVKMSKQLVPWIHQGTLQPPYHGLNVPPNSCQSLDPVIVLRSGAWEVIRSWAMEPHDWNLCFHEKGPRKLPSPSAWWGYYGKISVCEEVGSHWARSQPTPRTWTSSLPNCEKSLFAVYKPHSL